jgi:hypothetical protein
MQSIEFSHDQILRVAQFSAQDVAEINQRRRANNQLGFAYQLAFVRLTNRFPTQQPLEIVDELLTYVSMQLAIPIDAIEAYTQRRQTIAEHRVAILDYLNLRRFGETEVEMLEQFLFEEACRLEQTGPLLTRAKQFLREASILYPADDTLRRLIVAQRQQARDHIFARITESLSANQQENLDTLLVGGDNRLTPFHALKQPPGRPSPPAILRLTHKLEQIEGTGILTLNLAWLNNNYQRMLARYARRCSADRLRSLQPVHRYAVLTCFLGQVYRDTIDQMVEMHDKLMTGVYNRAQQAIDAELRKRRQLIRSTLATFKMMGNTILDGSVDDSELRQTLFTQVDPEKLARQIEAVDRLLTGKHSHVLNLVMQRFSYLRQFSPALLQSLTFRVEEGARASVVEAIDLLQEMNRENRRKLPEDAPLDFIPKPLRALVEKDGAVDKHAWECVLLTAIRDEIRAGNVFVEESKRFGRFADFFIDDTRWAARREDFFKRAGLPVNAEEVPAYFTDRINQAYDRFLTLLPENTYASVNEEGWQLSVDPGEKLDEAGPAHNGCRP